MKSTGAGADDAAEEVLDDETECRRKPRTRERTELEEVDADDKADAGLTKGSKGGWRLGIVRLGPGQGALRRGVFWSKLSSGSSAPSR